MGFNYGLSLSGMNAGQMGLKVAQQNVSNMNTEGYIRQRLDLKQSSNMEGSGYEKQIGTGVAVENIKLVVDEVLQSSSNKQSSKASYFKELESTLYQLETVSGEFTSGSLGNLMGGFFDAWSDVSKFPEEESYRFTLIGETEKLTNKMNDLSNEIMNVEATVKKRIDIDVEEVNRITQEIETINKKITQSGKNVPNTLLNERNQKVSELSNYMEVDATYEDANPNVVTVRAEGAILVDRDTSNKIRSIETGGEFRLATGSNYIELSSGKIKAGVDAINKYIGEYKTQLEDYSDTLRDAVNAEHKAGFSINGDTGYDFLVGNNSGNIKINPLIEKDSKLIASTSDPAVEGNVDVARSIAGIVDQPIINGLNFREHVNDFSIGMAQDVDTAKKQAQIQGELLSGINEQMQNLSGVNLEEEMTNMMMFQKFFSANAKAIKVVDEMNDSVLRLI